MKSTKTRTLVIETRNFRIAYQSTTTKVKPEKRELPEPKTLLPKKIDIYV